MKKERITRKEKKRKRRSEKVPNQIVNAISADGLSLTV
jgi:hypothetical protein